MLPGSAAIVACRVRLERLRRSMLLSYIRMPAHGLGARTEAGAPANNHRHAHRQSRGDCAISFALTHFVDALGADVLGADALQRSVKARRPVPVVLRSPIGRSVYLAARLSASLLLAPSPSKRPLGRRSRIQRAHWAGFFPSAGQRRFA